jgi:hypothetical protein
MQHSVIYAHSSTVNKSSYFSIYLQVGCLVLIPDNSTGNPCASMHKEYNMNTGHKHRRALQIVNQANHQLWEEPCSFVNTPQKTCSDYLWFGLFMHLVPIINLDNLYSDQQPTHTNHNKQTAPGSMSCRPNNLVITYADFTTCSSIQLVE